ncbi:MAG: UDP-N-acetylmuramate dehydrogenase [Solobacterium sp.]|nr:UDP-N-acetylmuramate dehydrogenase [Solobacterium sp.]
MDNRIYEILSGLGEAQKDVPLSTMTTLRIGGVSAVVFYPETLVGLDLAIRFLNRENIPFKLIGKGSDILASDERYEGVIIRLDKHFHTVYFCENEMISEAGSSIVGLANQAMKQGLSGLEFASGIPGTLGGGIFMNAGAYKSSFAAIVKEVLVYRNGGFDWLSNEECEFSYRETVFGKHPDWIIVAARMELEPKDPAEISKLMEDRRQRRIASQPLEYPSCGSVFRNPEGMNAWQLIDGIGYRGKKHGGATVSSKHCNFIVNEDHATAAEYMELVNEIIDKVKEKYDVDLVTEMEKFNWK